MNRSIRSSVNSSRLSNDRLRRFVARHPALLAVLLLLGAALLAINVGSLNTSASKGTRMSDNAPPTIANNTGTTVNEGSTGNVISNAQLSVSDTDNTPSELTYTVGTPPTSGTLKKSGSGLSSGSMFTQDDINNNLITYDHDGSETPSDSFMFTVSDGAGGTISNTAFSITVTPVNDPPTIANNTGITVNEGSTGNTISSAQLSVTDPDNTAGQLTYTVGTAPAKGTLKRSGSGLSGGSTFTQDDVNSSLITYDHDGSETTSDSFMFTVSDGAGGSIGSTPFSIIVTPTNDSPTLTTNGVLTVTRGHSGAIDNTKLLVSDADNTPAQLTFTIGTATLHGTLKKSATPLAASDTFTQDDINNNLITYQHNSGDASGADSFTFTVSDGAGGTIGTTTFNITINCVASPVVTNTNDTGNGTLREAILGACTSNTITFDPALTSGGPATITLTSAELAVDKSLTISGPTNNGLTISGAVSRRVLNVSAGVSLSFSNLTIANGKATTGGGILNAGTVTITNSTFTNNTTTDGGDVSSGTAGNGGNGGAIYNTGTLNLINSTVSGNLTGRGGDNLDTINPGTAGNSGSGAGVYNTGTAKVTNSTVANNQTGRAGHASADTAVTPGLVGVGGGIFSSGGTLTLNNTIVATNRDGFLDPDDVNAAVNPASRSNLIGTDAGLSGISNGSGGNQIGTAAIPLSPHLGPLADNGGPTKTHLPDQFSTAIDGGDNTKALDQNNVALATDQRGTGFPRKIDGGGAKPDEPTVDIGSVEVTQLAGTPGADLTVVKTVDRDTVVPDRDLTYTITITNSGADPATGVSWTDTLPRYTTNSDPDSPTYGNTTFVSLSPVSGWTCSGTSTITCNKTTSFPGTSSQTFTLKVHVPSDAVPNAGDPFVSNSVTVDDANDTNTENNGGFANTQLVSCVTNPIVTTNADSGPGSLRQAIADSCAGSTITFDMTPGHVASPITLTTAELLVDKNLTIQGPASNLLTVTRGGGVTPSFHILRTTTGNTVSISGLTLTNGVGTVSGSITDGGGIYNDATLTLSNSVVTGNTALTGGGIYNHGGALTLSNSTVSNNHANSGSGGGIENGLATLTVINSTINGNSAARTGGVEIADGTAKIINSTVSGNTASAAGGGIQTLAGTTTLTNVTVTNNHSDSDNTGGTDNGGGIRNGGGTITLRNTIVAGNYKGSGTSTANDIDQTVDPSSSFDLIGAGGSGGLGNSNGNQVGVANSLVGLLATNGGPTQTHLLLPGSPAINAGSNALAIDQSNAALTTDQRGTGFNRIVNSTVDIGAVEVNYSITATAGTPQSAVINSAFATALKANVKESGNNQVGIPVTFTAPGSGASGTFSGSATVNTDAGGVATAPAFTANGTAGGPYNVVASLGTGLPTAAFALTNTQAATSTAVTASPNPSNSGQSVTFTATVTSTAGTPTGTVQFKDGGTSIGSPQALNGSGVATFSTSSLTAGIHTITADYSGDPNFIASTGTLSGGQQVGAIIRFSSAAYNTTESSLSATITVQRSGELTSAVSVDYATPDDSAATTILPCSTPGFVSPRCDFTTAIGTLKFAANETSKTFEVLISQDNYVEGSEQFTLTLSNVSGNAALGAPSTATLTIADDVTEPAANPIDDSTNFVRQHYHDFLNREPLPADSAGLNFWVNQIESCGSDQACRDLRKVNVSGAFFLSIEFQQTGYYVYRTYKTAFGDINPPTVPVPVRYREFITDTKEVQRGVIVGQGAWQAQLDANKQAYALAFVARSGFQSRYPSSMTATAFVDGLNANAGNVLTPTQRADLISELTPNPADPALRADVLMKIAENALLKQQEMNRSFVLMQYFGYLRRNPDAAPEAGLNFNGFNFWLNKLNSFNGNFVNADMVKAFITSGEYRGRFGQ
ncbi:MAG: hypothetical protein QOH41_4022 [Blastocatellia bacterium]|nr:hypothetical protein [Blastocatellia bacterium]